jgi:hypothetical protein
MNSWEGNAVWEDPIVAEVHRIREQLAAAHNNDVKAMFADMRAREAALGDRLVRRVMKPEPIAEVEISPPAENPEPALTVVPS